MRAYWKNTGGQSPALLSFSETPCIPPLIWGDIEDTRTSSHLNSMISYPTGDSSELVFEESAGVISKNRVYAKEIEIKKHLPNNFLGFTTDAQALQLDDIKTQFLYSGAGDVITSAKCYDVACKVIKIVPANPGAEFDRRGKEKAIATLKSILQTYSDIYNRAKDATNNFGIEAFSGTIGKKPAISPSTTMKQNTKYVGTGGSISKALNENGDFLQRLYLNNSNDYLFTGDTAHTTASILRNNWCQDGNDQKYTDLATSNYVTGIPYFYSLMTSGGGTRASSGVVNVTNFKEFLKENFAGSNYTDLYLQKYGYNIKDVVIAHMAVLPYVPPCEKPWVGDGDGVFDSAIQDPFVYFNTEYYANDPRRYMYIDCSRGKDINHYKISGCYIVLTYLKNNIIDVTTSTSNLRNGFIYSCVEESRRWY